MAGHGEARRGMAAACKARRGGAGSGAASAGEARPRHGWARRGKARQGSGRAGRGEARRGWARFGWASPVNERSFVRASEGWHEDRRDMLLYPLGEIADKAIMTAD